MQSIFSHFGIDNNPLQRDPFVLLPIIRAAVLWREKLKFQPSLTTTFLPIDINGHPIFSSLFHKQHQMYNYQLHSIDQMHILMPFCKHSSTYTYVHSHISIFMLYVIIKAIVSNNTARFSMTLLSTTTCRHWTWIAAPPNDHIQAKSRPGLGRDDLAMNAATSIRCGQFFLPSIALSIARLLFVFDQKESGRWPLVTWPTRLTIVQ